MKSLASTVSVLWLITGVVVVIVHKGALSGALSETLAFMETKGEEIVRVLFQVAVFVSAITVIAKQTITQR